MNGLHDDVDLNKLYFKYEIPNKDIYSNDNHVSRKLFNRIKGLNIKFDGAVKTNNGNKKIVLK